MIIVSVLDLIKKFDGFFCDFYHQDIHLLISYPPDMAATSVVRKLKQTSAHQSRNKFPSSMRKHFWKEHIFWSDGCFVRSVGEAIPETIRKYIDCQG